MPKYYCDYCDIYLTRDSKQGRKAHFIGWRHKAGVREYYTKIAAKSTQIRINELVDAYEAELLSGLPVACPLGPHGHPGLMPPPSFSPSPDAPFQFSRVEQIHLDSGLYAPFLPLIHPLTEPLSDSSSSVSFNPIAQGQLDANVPFS